MIALNLIYALDIVDRYFLTNTCCKLTTESSPRFFSFRPDPMLNRAKLQRIRAKNQAFSFWSSLTRPNWAIIWFSQRFIDFSFEKEYFYAKNFELKTKTDQSGAQMDCDREIRPRSGLLIWQTDSFPPMIALIYALDIVDRYFLANTCCKYQFAVKVLLVPFILCCSTCCCCRLFAAAGNSPPVSVLHFQ